MRSRKLLALYGFLASAGIIFSSQVAASAQALAPNLSNSFADYFYGANSKDIGSDKDYPAYEALLQSIQTMSPGDIAAGLAVIDREMDANSAESQGYFAKAQAIFLLRYIALRPDGAELLSSQMDRLTSLLNDPSHPFIGPVALVFQALSYRKPEQVVPILEEALKNPEVNNKTGPGPGIAVILLRAKPNDPDIAEHVAQYMRRSDLSDKQLLDTIVGIDSSPVIPDSVSAELVRCLDRTNDIIKGRALVGISRSSSAAKEAAKLRVQRMANDPRETAHIRRLAAQVPKGKLTEDPDIDQPTN